MTYSELKARLRLRLNEATSVFFSDADIGESINEGYAEMADAAEFYERHWNIETLKGRTYYDLSTLFPDTFLSPRRCFSTALNKWLTPVSARDMDDGSYSQWELTKGPASSYLMRGNWWFGVWPKPGADGDMQRLYGTAIPPAMTRDADEPPFPNEFHEGIVEYGLADCLSQVRESKKAIAAWGRYLGYEAGLIEQVNGRQSIPRKVGL